MEHLNLKSRMNGADTAGRGLVEEARKELPALRKKAQEAYEAFERYNEAVEAAERLISVLQPESVSVQAKETPEVPPKSLHAPESPGPSGGRAARGAVYKHVDGVMNEGRPYNLRNLRRELLQRFGHKYGLSSVHRALAKGVEEKRFTYDGTAWRKA